MQESSSRPSRGGNSAPLPIRRRSAQELITLYELTDQITRAPESSKKRIQLTAPFHNLLGVFGKKGKKTHTEGHSKSPSRSRSPSPPGRKPLPAIPDTPRTIVPAKEDNVITTFQRLCHVLIYITPAVGGGFLSLSSTRNLATNMARMHRDTPAARPKATSSLPVKL